MPRTFETTRHEAGTRIWPPPKIARTWRVAPPGAIMASRRSMTPPPYHSSSVPPRNAVAVLW